MSLINLVHKLKYQKSKCRFVLFAKHVAESAMVFLVCKVRPNTRSVTKQCQWKYLGIQQSLHKADEGALLCFIGLIVVGHSGWSHYFGFNLSSS